MHVAIVATYICKMGAVVTFMLAIVYFKYIAISGTFSPMLAIAIRSYIS